MWETVTSSDVPLKDGKVCLTGDNFAELSGRKDITSQSLRVAQNRYLLQRAYKNGKSDDGYMSGKLF